MTMQKLNIRTINYLTPGLQNAGKSFDGDTKTSWFPGWAPASYPASLELIFTSSVNIRKIRVFDGAGIPVLRFIDPHDRVFLETRLDKYQIWREWDVNVDDETLVRIELSGIEGDTVVPEIEFWGDPLGGPVTPPPNPVDPETPVATGAALVGTNGFHWVPWGLLAPFSILRAYQMAEWTWTPAGIAVDPSSRGNVNLDTWLAEAQKRGITVAPCINKAPGWFHSLPDGQMTDPDDRGNAHRADAYQQWSSYLFQIAARYGRKTWPDAALSVNTMPRWENDPVNVRKSGLGLLQYIEPENETNRWWRPANEQYTPEQAAAMLSAAYDGHCGSLGALCGIKTADPTMQVVMPGLADINVPYLDAMLRWCQQNRADGRFPADVLNVHHYCNTGNHPGDPRVNMTGTGCHPEADDLRGRLSDLVRWRDKNLPGLPVWLSEVGYDTHQNSVQRAVPHGGRSAESVQGLWLARTYLEAAAAGVDRCFLFNAIDEPGAANGGLFTSCGIARGENAGFVKKESWSMIAALAAALTGRRFAADLSPSPEVRLYAFSGEGGPLLVAWLPVADGSTKTVWIDDDSHLISEEPKFLKIKFN